MAAPTTLLTQVLNALALGVVLAVAVAVPLLVARDAQRRGAPWGRALRRGLTTLALLPLAVAACLFLGQSARTEREEPA